MDDNQVTAVRQFNRMWTARIGALGSGHLGTAYSLTEVRVLFELARHDVTDLADLRTALDLDAGYLTRIVKRLRNDGLVRSSTSSADARRQVLVLTAKGRKAFGDLDARATAEIGALLDELTPEDRRRLTSALGVVTSLFSATEQGQPYVIRGLRPGDLGWVVQRHGVLYADEYHWDETFEALVARIVADYVDRRDPQRDSAWIAERDGEPIGCVFCVRKNRTTAQLRILLVDPKARGLGVGARLVDECVRFARQAGYRKMVLWTNDVLVSARRIYQAAGFELVEEEKHQSFGHDLVGQLWELDL